MISVNQLFIFPVKSLQGISVQEGITNPDGFKLDRQFMLTTSNGDFITARDFPQLLKLKTEVLANGIKITSPNNDELIVDYEDFSSAQEKTQVWGNIFTAYIGSINANRWLSDYLNIDVQLRWIGKESSRKVTRFPDTALSFADGYPYMLINQSSFDYLEQQCSEKMDIRQFRANIIIKGSLPFAEDAWKTIRIGEVIFDVVTPCSRCVLINTDINTAKRNAHNEPLKTLGYFRSDSKGKIDFGMNLIARNQGKIKISDKVEIIETQSPKAYIKQTHVKEAYKKVKIQYREHLFVGNNQQTLLEQFEANNIQIPYSCRAGVCGRCQVSLNSGVVSSLSIKKLTIREGKEQKIFTCCCIPQSDLELA